MKPPYFTRYGKDTSLLTWTSAMDCWSWSLPAGKNGACPMESRAANSICNSCYAQQGRYLFRNVRGAQLARFAYLKETPDLCLSQISDFIHSNRLPYFRVHDSGDFHSLDMIHRWTLLAASIPNTSFWFPTRGWVFPHWMDALATLAALPNATVRPSALHFGDEPPTIPNLSPGTSSMEEPAAHIHDCPKALLGGSCGSNYCRTCWEDIAPVNYYPHGHTISPKERLITLTIGAS